MKWLENKIKFIVDNAIKLYYTDIDKLKNENDLLRSELKSMQEILRKIDVNLISCRNYVDIREQLLRESFFNTEKSLNCSIRELRINSKDDIELAVSGLIKLIDNRLNGMSNKKSIVTDLLKKIAKLED